MGTGVERGAPLSPAVRRYSDRPGEQRQRKPTIATIRAHRPPFPEYFDLERFAERIRRRRRYARSPVGGVERVRSGAVQ